MLQEARGRGGAERVAVCEPGLRWLPVEGVRLEKVLHTRYEENPRKNGNYCIAGIRLGFA